MVKEMKNHNILKCKTCERILFLLTLKKAFGPARGIRLNKFHRLAKEYIEKCSKPTLLDHLNALVKEKIVKRIVRGKQNTAYYLPENSTLISKDILEETEKLGDSLNKKLREQPIKSLIIKVLEISELAEAERLKLWFESQLPGKNSKEIAFRFFFTEGLYRFIIEELLYNAMRDRGASKYKEYQNAVELLDKEIEAAKRKAFDEWHY
jgi:DNA-binding HxlR family transcriptional regulator